MKIQITIPSRRVYSQYADPKRREKFHQVMFEAFCMRPYEVPDVVGEGLTIWCSPEQFAKFIVLRNKYGIDNGIKELNPQIIEPTKPVALDVSFRK